MPAEETTLLTAMECRIAAERFEALAGTLRACEEKIENGRGKLSSGIWVFRKPSLRFALDRCESFDRELTKAMQAIDLGTPYDANTPKNRKEREKATKVQTRRLKAAKTTKTRGRK